MSEQQSCGAEHDEGSAPIEIDVHVDGEIVVKTESDEVEEVPGEGETDGGADETDGETDGGADEVPGEEVPLPGDETEGETDEADEVPGDEVPLPGDEADETGEEQVPGV